MENNNDGFMYGLASFTFDGKDLGYIEEDAFDLGGSAGEVTQIKAAQRPDYPVLAIPKTNGTISPKFDLIQLNVKNLQAVMGGTVSGKKWSTPLRPVIIAGKVDIKTSSGHEINIERAMVQAHLDGNLNLTSVGKIKCTLTVLDPGDEVSPFSMTEPGEENGG